MVSDDKINGGTPFEISAEGLGIGASVTGTATYIIKQEDLDAGSVTNIAIATGKLGTETVTSNEATTIITAEKMPSLTIDKTASPTIYYTIGQKITYTYNVTNTGNVAIDGPINVTDNKTGTVEISSSGLAPGQSVTGTSTYTITLDDLKTGSVTNAAFATGTFNGIEVKSNTDTATVTAKHDGQCCSPALTIIKSANPIIYNAVNQTITYTYIVINTGNVAIDGPIMVSDNKINGGTPFKISDKGLDIGKSVTGKATYTITQADIIAGSVTNAAFATGTFNGTEVKSNTGTARVTGQCCSIPDGNSMPALKIIKLANPITYNAANQIITYTYIVTNTGNVAIDGPIMVSDNKINGGTPFEISDEGLNVRKIVTGKATYTITQADIIAGSVTNIAIATGKFNNQPVASEPITATVRKITLTV